MISSLNCKKICFHFEIIINSTTQCEENVANAGLSYKTTTQCNEMKEITAGCDIYYAVLSHDYSM